MKTNNGETITVGATVKTLYGQGRVQDLCQSDYGDYMLAEVCLFENTGHKETYWFVEAQVLSVVNCSA